MKDYLSIKEVAQDLGVTVQSVYRLIDRGTLGCVTIGAQRCVKPGALKALKESPDYIRRARAARKANESEQQGLGA